MVNTFFQIGDLVTDIFDRERYEIIGTRSTPYLMAGLGNVYPLEGNDFVLRPQKLLEGFTPFHHAKAEHLEKVN